MTTSSAEPEAWQQTFLQIVNNEAKRHPDTGTARTGGFVIVVTGTTSLQHVQELCHSRQQDYGRCLTARYDVGGAPLPGSLLAAFAADVATLSADRPRTVGHLLPAPERDGPWRALVRNDRVRALLRLLVSTRSAGADLGDSWIDQFGQALGNEEALRVGQRLVLFAEAVDSRWLSTQDEAALLALAGRLPERCGLVITAPGLDEPTRVVHPSLTYLDVEEAPLPNQAAAEYTGLAFTGDQIADDDTLGRERYAAALANLVMLPDTGPVTIGIHAPWGAGKSSFMHFVDRNLRLAALPTRRAPATPADAYLASTAPGHAPPKLGWLTRWRVRQVGRGVAQRVIPVWFNAWQYEGARQIWAGLTHQITQAMEQSMSWRRRMAARVGYTIHRRGAQFWLGIVTPLVIAGLVAAATIRLGVGGKLAAVAPKDVQALAKALPATLVATLGVLFVLTRFFKRVKPVSEGLLDYVRQPNYREHMGYQHQVLEDILYLAGRLRRKGRDPRVVVFIDDLDRCSDEKVLETLQAINLLLTASGCYVFLGIDTDMIIRAIQRHFDFETDPQDKARSYLRKILQMNLRLHPPAGGGKLDFLDDFFTPETRAEFAGINERSPEAPQTSGRPPLGWDLSRVRPPAQYIVQLTQVTDTVHELWAFHQLADLVPDNPRELKRLVNVHRLVKILLTGAGVRPSSAEQRLLVGWLLYCFDAPINAAVTVARSRRQVTDKPDTGGHHVDDDRLIAILDRLSKEPPPSDDGNGPLRLTVGQLLPGTQDSEAWEISSLFRMSV